MTNSNENGEDVSLVEEVSTLVSTDVVADLKSGIFNLFNSLYASYSYQYGPVDGMIMAIEYLKSIIDFFQNTLEENIK